MVYHSLRPEMGHTVLSCDTARVCGLFASEEFNAKMISRFIN